VALRLVAVAHADVDEPLRELLHRRPIGQVAVAERLEREQRGGDAVAGRDEAHLDDVARLLAPERPAALAQRLEHVAVADLGRGDLDARRPHAGVEAVVRHHRHRDARHAEVDGGERDQLVAVDDDAVAVDRQHAVAVAVEREARVVAAVAHGGGERLHVGRAAARVDVAAVGLGRDHVDRGAEAAEDGRGDLERRAVGAVEHDPPAAQVQAAEPLLQRRLVAVERAVEAAHAPGAGGLGRLLEHLLDLELGGVGQLEAVAAEELDAVVAVRVVRRGQHDREREAVAAHEQRRSGRRQHAAEQRHAAGRGDAGGDGGLQHLAGLARVADHQHARRGVGLLARRGDARGGRPGERERELGGDDLAGDAADAVGAEQLAAAGGRGRPRSGHGCSAPVAAPTSAWRTAAACAPS
jgi:hypothetical protein